MIWSGIGALALALAVGMGAFGAHGLRGRLDAYSMGIYERAVFYHFIHAIGLLVVPLFCARRSPLGILRHTGGASPGCGDPAFFGQPLHLGAHRYSQLGCGYALWWHRLHSGMVVAGVVPDPRSATVS